MWRISTFPEVSPNIDLDPWAKTHKRDANIWRERWLVLLEVPHVNQWQRRGAEDKNDKGASEERNCSALDKSILTTHPLTGPKKAECWENTLIFVVCSRRADIRQSTRALFEEDSKKYHLIFYYFIHWGRLAQLCHWAQMGNSRHTKRKLYNLKNEEKCFCVG